MSGKSVTTRNGVQGRLLDDFVAVDIETTGLDPATSEILELAAVRFRNGDVSETFEQLVLPNGDIPVEVQMLTGIKPEAVTGCPRLRDVLAPFRDFVGRSPIVGHNLGFDLSFLEPALRQHGLPSMPAERIDTLLLSRLLFPKGEAHSLAVMQSLLNVAADGEHRAAADAAAAGRVLLSLTGRASEMGREALQALADACATVPPLDRLLGEFASDAVGRGIAKPEAERNFLPRLDTPARKRGSLEDDVSRFLGPGGPLSAVLPGYECRHEQIDMAVEVARTFDREEILVVEAGTGVGKTLAYLVPSLIAAHRLEKRVVVSTRTKNLQEQVFRHDLPLLRRAGLAPVAAALLKGMSNYLCLRKYREGMERGITGATADALLPVVAWMRTTRTGDLEEGIALTRAARFIAADPGTCLGTRCPHRRRCFYQAARRQAQQAGLVVANHALLVADIRAGGAVLGPYSFLIVDEAHALEQTALDGFGGACWLAELERRTRQVEALAGRDTGLRAACAEVVESARSFFDLVTTAAQHVSATGPEGAGKRVRFVGGDQFHSVWGSESLALAENVKRFTHDVRQLGRRLSAGSDAESRTAADLQGIADVLDEWGSRLAILGLGEERDRVFWCEQSRDRWGLVEAPVEVGHVLRETPFGAVKGAVCCSATLAVESSFDFFRERVGLADSPRVGEAHFGSPFDLEGQLMIAIASYLPPPRGDGFARELTRAVAAVSQVLGRGAMVLFTSHSLLRESRTLLDGVVAGAPLLAQGLDGSRSSLKDRFGRSKEAILLGADSFWEGIDLPGEALECLVITKLPFPVPTDPVIQAQAERVEAVGRNGFEHYMLPKAVLKLRQGIGRLIRTRDDKGVAVVLDGRLLTARYGRVFLESLAVKPVLARTEDELVALLASWKTKAGWT
jgi:Rad3-related DNA helicase/DNA polymerase III epsilon subunit-like protein